MDPAPRRTCPPRSAAATGNNATAGNRASRSRQRTDWTSQTPLAGTLDPVTHSPCVPSHPHTQSNVCFPFFPKRQKLQCSAGCQSMVTINRLPRAAPRASQSFATPTISCPFITASAPRFILSPRIAFAGARDLASRRRSPGVRPVSRAFVHEIILHAHRHHRVSRAEVHARLGPSRAARARLLSPRRPPSRPRAPSRAALSPRARARAVARARRRAPSRSTVVPRRRSIRRRRASRVALRRPRHDRATPSPRSSTSSTATSRASTATSRARSDARA